MTQEELIETEQPAPNYPELRAKIAAAAEAEGAWQAALDQCKNVDTATHKALNDALTVARAELAQSQIDDHLEVAAAVVTGKKLPSDGAYLKHRGYERIRTAPMHHAEVVAVRNNATYHKKLADLLDARADVIGEAARLRQQTLARLAEPMLEFEGAQSVSIADRGTLTIELQSQPNALRTSARRVKSGEKLALGVIPDDWDYQRTYGGILRGLEAS